ncbi:HAD-IIIA family hydrolase [Extibacter muris]|uniref:HAD-IIIA family hydrolase n=1 Tax=Extibacter muris TaxID=1796622 RepID=UPI001D06EDDA|nr:HAD-IIIA family hydrolase [Extibacter muris]MCB6202632.1 HAD-IIIA family hydrolase [Extibacter muris]MCQ4663869.1 HAD-IIIA family hydrolase [Extibacter muris]MCQ4693435.1 HAD-IIIA family hydrolase [Extibacter muris]
MKTVIMAGGMGTRIAAVNALVPKPMITILGKPILEYQIECLEKQGYTDIIIVIGYKGEQIQAYFRDGADFGVNIEYIVEQSPLGTAGALYILKNRIEEEFLLINGDIIFDIDIGRFVEHHRKKEGKATIFIHPNDHPFDSGIIKADMDGRVFQWLCKEDERKWYKNRVNAGLHILSPQILYEMRELKKMDMDRDILRQLIPQGLLYAYDSPEYVKDMGTPERLAEVEMDILSGKVKKKNLREKQRAVFLDRDGTINEYVGFLKHIDDFKLISGVEAAIRRINKSGYLAIVVTNQPVIARGEATIEELEEIHNKMETLLGRGGAYIDALYYCPHHPDKGYEGEREEYKVKCECRKPSPGLLLSAAKAYNIDMSRSWMIGDSDTDMEAGNAAGCKTAKIGKGEKYTDLLCCIQDILQ